MWFDPDPRGAAGPVGGAVVRLPAEDFEAIERIAAQANVLVGALIRGWVLAGLAEEAQRLRRLAAVSDVA